MLNAKTNVVCYAIIQPEHISTAYIDLTGRFPKKTSRGNEYILVGYYHDGNCILGYPIKNRRGPTITEAWEALHNQFKLAGFPSEMYVIENETSRDLLLAFEQEDI